MFLKRLQELFKPRKQFKIQSFTYFIPSPPHRKSGYREKQFDKVFNTFINIGFEILTLNTQANNNSDAPGMWVLITARATNHKANNLNIDDFLNEDYQVNNTNSEKTDESIEGIYYI